MSRPRSSGGGTCPGSSAPAPFSLVYSSNTSAPWMTPALASRSAILCVDAPAGMATVTAGPGLPAGVDVMAHPDVADCAHHYDSDRHHTGRQRPPPPALLPAALTTTVRTTSVGGTDGRLLRCVAVIGEDRALVAELVQIDGF